VWHVNRGVDVASQIHINLIRIWRAKSVRFRCKVTLRSKLPAIIATVFRLSYLKNRHKLAKKIIKIRLWLFSKKVKKRTIHLSINQCTVIETYSVVTNIYLRKQLYSWTETKNWIQQDRILSIRWVTDTGKVSDLESITSLHSHYRHDLGFHMSSKFLL